MRSLTLYIFTILSFFVHLLFIAIALFIQNKKTAPILPSLYTVDLVSSDLLLPPSSSSVSGKRESEAVIREPEFRSRKIPKSEIRDPKSEKSRNDDQWVSERIAAIQAKKRIEEIANLRNTISLKAGGAGKEGESKGVGSQKGAPSADDYNSRITSEIRRHWVYPDLGNKDIETIIVIRILKDGSVQIKNIEKSSGNNLFDRSALRAIKKASPLPPPPYEMEIGVRFYP